MARHVVFRREQILSIAAQLDEFPSILLVDFQFTEDNSMEPLRVEYIWEDE